jgi:hypothetical protein
MLTFIAINLSIALTVVMIARRLTRGRWEAVVGLGYRSSIVRWHRQASMRQ